MNNSYTFHNKHIHRTIRKHAPKSVRKANEFFSFKYPRLFLLFASMIIAYLLFQQPQILDFFSGLQKFNYFGMFIAGILFSLGFSTPFSIGFFIISHPQNIILATFLASIGSVVGDMIIFDTIKDAFMKEFNELGKKKIVRVVENAVKKNKNILIRHYLLYIFAGLMIITPMPDEIGVSMLAGLTTIKTYKLAIISFILHAIPIFLILYFSAA